MSKRRSHSKVDALPPELRETINDAVVNKKMTYKEITDIVRNAGHVNISQKSIERYGKKFADKLESLTMAKEQARSILETSAGLKLDMAEASSTVAFNLLFNMLLNTKDGEVDKNTLNAIKSLASLERSAVGREKLKLQYDKGVTDAIATVKHNLQSELELYPEITKQIHDILNDVEQKMKEDNK